MKDETANNNRNGLFLEYHWEHFCFEIVSIYGKMFGFALGTAYGIKLGMVESIDLGSLIGFPKIYRNN